MRYAILVILALLADQGTKWLAEVRLAPVGTLPLIKDVFHLTYARNTGAAFSILKNQQLLLILITTAVMAFLGLWLVRLAQRPDHWMLKTALALVLAGGVGNLIDRVRLNYVIDFLDFRLINYPVFNVADCCIVIGTGLLCFVMLTRELPV